MSNISKAIKAVLLQNPDLTAVNFQDCASHGADGGVSGFIYYTETEAFYDTNEDLINDMLEYDLKEVCDEGTTMIQMLKGFGRGGDLTVTSEDLVFDEDTEEYNEDDVEFTEEVVFRETNYDNMQVQAIEKDTSYKNLMAWFVLENVARHIEQLLDEKEIDQVKAFGIDCEEWEDYNL